MLARINLLGQQERLVVLLLQYDDFPRPKGSDHSMIVGPRDKEEVKAEKKASVKQSQLKIERLNYLTGEAGLDVVAADFFFTAVFFFCNYKTQGVIDYKVKGFQKELVKNTYP